MSAPEHRDSPRPARAGRRRFLKQAGALVATAPVAVVLQATAQAATTRKKPSRPAAAPAKPAPDPFAASHPDLSLIRNAEERVSLEKQWKAMQEALDMVRKAPLAPATEPVTVFAAMPMTRTREG